MYQSGTAPRATQLPHTPGPPPVGWAEKYRRLMTPTADDPAPHALPRPAGHPADLTWGELAAALFLKVEESLDRLNEAIKDALIDGELPAPSADSPEDAPPLAPLSREGFVEAMRPRVEEALRELADCLNTDGGDDAVGRLLEALVRDALRTALEMRAHPPTGSPVPQESLH